MSFVRTLATLAVGFAAAKGVQKFNQAGGLDNMKEKLRTAGEEGGWADQMGQMAEKMGVPGGGDAVRDMMAKFGQQAADGTEAAEAGMGNLMSAMTGAAAAGAGGIAGMFDSLTKGTPVGAANEENAKLMIRAMIQAAKSDGEIDEAERKTILDHLGDASEEEIKFVQEALDAPVDAGALAKDATENTKAQIYASALMAINVDTEAEKRFLADLASAMGLEAPKVKEIHDTMGKPFV